MAKKHELGKKKIRLSRAVAVEHKVCATHTTYSFPLKAKKLEFWLP
jgi:hypothetical protein